MFFAAARFLTIFPVPGSWGSSRESLGRSAPAFPLVGLLLGGACGLVALLADRYLSGGVSASLCVVALAVLSGGLHLDGLADSADGLCVPRAKDRALEIMRDPHTGAMGVIAVVSVLLLKTMALMELDAQSRWLAVVMMPVAGRTALVIGMAVMPYIRESGLGSPFYEKRPRLAAVWSVAVLGALGWFAAEWGGIVVAGVSTAAALLLAGMIVRRLGGTTGDTLGALCECVEIAVPVTFVAIG